MRLAAGGGHRKLGVLFDASLVQARHKIAREKRTIRGRAQHPRNFRPVGGHPVEPGENAGERAREIRDRIGNDRQAETCKPLRIAIGVEDEPVALRLQPRDHALKDRTAADLPHRLVAAADPPCQPAGQQYAGSWWRLTRHVRRSANPVREVRDWSLIMTAA
jgi:hypothetical protein